MPTVLTAKAQDQSTYKVTMAFTDSAGAAVVPDSVVWQLTNQLGKTVNSRTGTTETPAASIDVILSGNDLDASDGQVRVLTVQAVYDSDEGNNLPLKAECMFEVEDLLNV